MPASGDDKVSENVRDAKHESNPPSNPPEYTKPKIRRYDQIEQVKPYGPSERRAG
jgi:hypothetical protein